MKSYQNAVYLSALVLLSVVLWLPRFQGPLDFRWDGATYYVLGTALGEGKGYRLLNEPGEIQAIQYPPLLPLMAAAFQKLAGTSDPGIVGTWLRRSFIAIFMVYAIAVYALSRLFLAPVLAFLVSLITILHDWTIIMSGLFFPELPFALTTMLFLYLTVRGNKGLHFWGAWLLGIGSFLFRSIGTALLVAWVGESLFNRRFREMASRAILALIPIIGWQAYTLQVKSNLEYAQPTYEYQRAAYQYHNVGYLENMALVDLSYPELGTVTTKVLMNRIRGNVVAVPFNLGEGVSAWTTWAKEKIWQINAGLETKQSLLWIVDVFQALLGIIVLYGLLELALRRQWIIPLYVGGSLALICLTPWPEQVERYLTPLTPLLALALFIALGAGQERLSTLARGRWTFASRGFVIIVTCGVFIIQVGSAHWLYKQQSRKVNFEDESGQRFEYRATYYNDNWRSYDLSLNWLKTHARPDSTIATLETHWAFLKTGLKSVLPPFEADTEKAQRLMDSVPVNYLIVDSLPWPISRRYALPVVEAFPERWRLIYSSPDNSSQIYQRLTNH